MCWRRRRSGGWDCVVLEEQGVGGGRMCRDDGIGRRSNDLSLFLFYSAVVAQLGSFLVHLISGSSLSVCWESPFTVLYVGAFFFLFLFYPLQLQ